MLDPFTAIGLASAILQFVDFGSRVVTGCHEIYNSEKGTLQENAEIEHIAKDVSRLNGRILSSRSGPSSDSPAQDDKVLIELVQMCDEIASDLLIVLGSLKIEGSSSRKWTSLRKAVASHTPWNKSKIQDLGQRLHRVQKQIAQHLLTSMTDKQSSIYSMLSRLANEQILSLQTEIVSAVREEGQNSGFLHVKVSSQLSMLAEKAKEQAILDVIQSLSPGITKARDSGIAEAHGSTFEWLHDEHGPLKGDNNFAVWLRSRGGMYWISGQPGSGKSTLMKYIMENPQTRQNLQEWARGKKIFFASCFLWNAGENLQKSLLGLLQSLLYDTFSEEPDLVAKICPTRLFHFSSIAKQWTLKEALDTFSSLQTSQVSAVFYCLIDGLDEYDGDHMEIIRLLKQLASSDGVKICFSSRPWRIFRDMFHSFPRLSLEDHTEPDIKRYVDNVLVQDERYAALAKTDSRYHRIPQTIIVDSKGVFLWVKLVVGQLLRGLSNADNINDLEMRLYHLPRKIEEYYQKVFDRLDEFYKQDTARILLMVAAAGGKLQVGVIASSELSRQKSEFWADDSCTEQRNAYFDNAYRTCLERLESRCQDFVTVRTQIFLTLRFRYTVEFLHSTVADFLRTPSMGKRLLSASGKDFDARRCILHGILAQLKYQLIPQPINNKLRKSREIFHPTYVLSLTSQFLRQFSEAEKEGKTTYVLFLEEFDRVLLSRPGIRKLIWYVDQRLVPSDDHQSDLLVFAILRNWQLYVAWKLKQEPKKIRRGRRCPLLAYALGITCPVTTEVLLEPDDCNPSMVKLLLLHGADVFESACSPTSTASLPHNILDLFLVGLHSESRDKITEDQYQALLLLLEAAGRHSQSSWYLVTNSGGYSTLFSGYYPRRMTILDIVRDTFSNPEAAELEAVIMRSFWWRYHRHWTESLLGKGMVSTCFIILDSIRLHNACTYNMYKIAYALTHEMLGSLVRNPFESRKPGTYSDGEDAGDWLPNWIFIPICIIGFALILLYTSLWLYVLYLFYKWYRPLLAQTAFGHFSGRCLPEKLDFKSIFWL
ncbi:hypothetical protein MMC19_007059 [Ptychographa xylographoides]|nr:hypothetical protein [Ptychographa xylographoides]